MLSAFILFRQKESIKVEKANIPFVFGRSFFGFIGMVANFYALENLTMAEANMLNKLSPVFVTICACIFLKERVDKKQVYRNNFDAFGSSFCNKTKFFTRGYSKFSRTFFSYTCRIFFIR